MLFFGRSRALYNSGLVEVEQCFLRKFMSKNDKIDDLILASKVKEAYNFLYACYRKNETRFL